MKRIGWHAQIESVPRTTLVVVVLWCGRGSDFKRSRGRRASVQVGSVVVVLLMMEGRGKKPDGSKEKGIYVVPKPYL